MNRTVLIVVLLIAILGAVAGVAYMATHMGKPTGGEYKATEAPEGEGRGPVPNSGPVQKEPGALPGG